ncbi:YggS family pyridoxal phosphate enzyme [Deinococcus yunweiensis]|uniref:YggS family pyridoxal phosphate enzyme n=1 Tax=Deinococcus yunweiensis TaxID=367282 RepID=UPI00398E55F6
MSVPEVLAGLRRAEREAGRSAGSARLVAVTKGHTLDEIDMHILAHGAFPLGESRGQELRDKSTLRPELEWHFIGPLQRNKVKYLNRVTLIHTIEAVWQAEAIAQAAQGWGHAPDVLIQLHNGEPQKHGVSAHDLPATVNAVRATGLQVSGVMVIAPDMAAGADPTGILRVFQETATRAHDLGLSELSMGMSADYPLAVQAGATLIRVGRSLFT